LQSVGGRIIYDVLFAECGIGSIIMLFVMFIAYVASGAG
jgi:hypothetical protein